MKFQIFSLTTNIVNHFPWNGSLTSNYFEKLSSKSPNLNNHYFLSAVLSSKNNVTWKTKHLLQLKTKQPHKCFPWSQLFTLTSRRNASSIPPRSTDKNLSWLQFSCSVVSDSLWPHGLQLARPPCPSPTPGGYSNSCPLSWWCHPTILSSVIPFSSCLQSFPESGSFPMS